MFQQFTYFELNYILKHLVYPSIFSSALWMSRMIDENPATIVKFRLKEAQKKVSRGLILSELITNDENTRPIQPVFNEILASLDDTKETTQDEQKPLAKKKTKKKPTVAKSEMDQLDDNDED